MTISVLVVDALARGAYGKRQVTVDVIGAGPRTVVGVLEQLHDIDVDLYVAEEVVSSKDKLKYFDVLMISAMSIDEETVKRIVKIWRNLREHAPVIVGGPAVLDEEFIVRVNADLAVYGEAEPVILNLFKRGIVDRSGVNTESLSELCGVIYRVPSSKSVRVNRRCPIMTRKEWEKYRPSTRIITKYPLFWAARVYVEVVRGCSNYTIPQMEDILPRKLLPNKPVPGCAYCSVVPLWGYARSRSIELVYDEVKKLIDQGVHRIVLSGPDFLDYGRDRLVEPKPLVDPVNPRANVKAIRELLRRLADIPEVSSEEASVMVENVKPSLVDENSAAALGDYLRGTPVNVGVETGDDRLLAALGRPVSYKKSIEAVKLLIRHGLRVYVYIMYCLPGENEKTIAKTIELMEKLYRIGVEKITAYKFMPLPKSYLEKLINKVKCKPNHPVRAKSIELNKKAKRKLIGKTMTAIVVGKHPRYKKPLAYPLHHGPVIMLENIAETGEIVRVRLTGIVSDRIVMGAIIQRKGRVISVEH
jgi:radical SAM superfamily enzyme YgiQ (UPF0313 family)